MAENKAPGRRFKAWHALLALLAGTGAVTTAVLIAGSTSTAAPYDFNGDGKPDLTIGLPGDTINSHPRAGSVIIANGTTSGPASTSARIDQQSPQVPGSAEDDDHFGQAFTSGDFDNDGYADLAVATPLESVGTTQGAGMITVHYGSSGGLYDSRTNSFHEDTTGIPGSASKDALFAYSLAAGDLNGDGYADLAIGQPLDNTGGDANAGTIKVMFGSSSGLTASDTIELDQSTPNVPGTPEPQDRFGEQIAIGDINADGTDDLISATIGEQISGSSDRGSIHVLYGPIDDAPAAGGYIDSGNVTGIGEFAGSALALGHFNNDPYLDLAVGVSDQQVNDRGAAGALAVFYADANGLSTTRVELFDQNTPGIAGIPEMEDYFTASLAASDFDGDGTDDLVLGVRSESIGSTKGAGAALILFGNPTGGITTTGSLWIDQDTTGIPGVVAAQDHFGWTVGALDTDANGRTEPLIGAPGNAAGTVTILKVTPGTLQSATALAEADLGRPAGSNGDAFGIALAH